MQIDGNTEGGRNAVRSIWMVSREYHGLAGAGGVKDVCRQLAEALARHGRASVSVVMPRYGFMDADRLGFSLEQIGDKSGVIGGRRYEHVFEVDMDYTAEERREIVAVWRKEINGVAVVLIEAERFAAKRGVYTYTEEEAKEAAWQRRGEGHYDYFAMNILLQKAALDLMILLEARPDVIHCQDGHAAVLPAMMRENSGYRHYFHRTGAVVTIHNAGLGYHQEVGDLAFAHAVTDLPLRVVMKARLGGSFDPFIVASDYAVLNTVSENYGRELQQTPDDARTGWLGHALLKRGVTLAGVTNGIDPASFDPTQPRRLGLTAGYDVLAGDLVGKQQCKAALLDRIAARGPWDEVRQFGGLSAATDAPLLTFIGRLTTQKGVDVLIEAAGELLLADGSWQLLVFGSGAPEFELQLEQLATLGPGQGRVCFLQGYDPVLANSVYAAGDFFLIPSRYEPCGLTDYIAQLLGNLPIVHRVGGLVKVLDGETGFSYGDNTPAALTAAILQALETHRREPETIRSMQRGAVKHILQRHTWEKVMEAYVGLYQQAMRMCCRER
ncbi:glycogen synthase [Desulfobulbus sp.]|uniref:glycogen synthase n=1 Tax=Desulfobulbus sp. TaxID=895 RepID=UPI0027B9FC9D|nr:glycogen/starch synthase [Desulfobulbus sp.]